MRVSCWGSSLARAVVTRRTVLTATATATPAPTLATAWPIGALLLGHIVETGFAFLRRGQLNDVLGCQIPAGQPWVSRRVTVDLEDCVPQMAAHVFAREFALGKNAAADHWVDVLPNHFAGWCNLEQVADYACANQGIAIGQTMGSGDFRGEEVGAVRRFVMPNGFVRAVGFAGFEDIMAAGI